MSTDNKAATYHRVNKLIDSKRLNEAFSSLRQLLTATTLPRLSDRLDKIEETYRYLLHYLMEGIVDSGREQMLDDIVAQLRFINDSIYRSNIMADSPDIYSSTKRFENIRKATLQSRLSEYRDARAKASLAMETDSAPEFAKASDEALLALFSYIWTMFGASQEDYNTLVESVKDPDMPFEFKAQVISALMLGNLAYYDRNGLISLIDIYDADISQKLSARALVAITLVVAANPKAVANDFQVKQRLALWQDSIITYRRLREVVMNIIRSRDTERISSKMQDEVIPELMKLQPEVLSRLKNLSSEADFEMLDQNPEWEELLNKNGLSDKLKELTEMQLEGGDVMMVAFSNLKSFPFFNSVANWFLPFYSTHSEFLINPDEIFNSFSELLDAEGVMCDSDKYSFAFSIGKMPQQQREMMSQQMSQQMQQLKEAMADKKLKSSVPEFDSEVTRYVRDIYRFFKLYRRKTDFSDPFGSPLDFRALPWLSEIISDTEILNLVGEFYFKRGYYAEALPILETLSTDETDNYMLWEKIGYCHQALKNLDKAIEWYKKSELIDPDSKWLIRKLAICHRLKGLYSEAAAYYARALDSDPDNYSLLMSAGNCLLESGDITGALANYYHADYVKPGKPSNRRSIAWAELINGNTDKSIEIYGKLTSASEATAADWINYGHSLFLAGRLKDAVSAYLRAVRMQKDGISMLEMTVTDDMPELERLGADPAVMSLILDKVRYDI